MKADSYGELYLWNRGIDRLVRVLQRTEAHSLCWKEKRKAYETRLEEIRAGLNADFAEAKATEERNDETRLRMQRTAWEARNANSQQNKRSQT
jgi:hypothetical protein